MNRESSFSKTEESVLKNHPLYQTGEDDFIFKTGKKIEELNKQIQDLLEENKKLKSELSDIKLRD